MGFLVLMMFIDKGHSEVIDSPPFPERKRKIHSSTWNSIILKGKVFAVGVEFFIKPFSTKTGRKEKSQFLKGNLNVALTPWSTSLRVKTAIPCWCFLSILRTGENSRWIDD